MTRPGLCLTRPLITAWCSSLGMPQDLVRTVRNGDGLASEPTPMPPRKPWFRRCHASSPLGPRTRGVVHLPCLIARGYSGQYLETMEISWEHRKYVDKNGKYVCTWWEIVGEVATIKVANSQQYKIQPTEHM